MHKRARSSGPIGVGAVGGDFPSELPSPSPSGFGAGGGGAGGIGAGAGAAPASGVARVAAKLLELDAAQAAVRAEEQADLEALQRRKLIEDVGAKAAEVEGLRARVAAVQARKAAAEERHKALQLLAQVQATVEDAWVACGGGGR